MLVIIVRTTYGEFWFYERIGITPKVQPRYSHQGVISHVVVDGYTAIGDPVAHRKMTFYGSFSIEEVKQK